MTWGALLKFELQAIFTNPALVLTVFGGVIFYSLLYPLPYSQQLPREQTVVVVDLDSTAISRKLIRMVDATPQIRIVALASSVANAKAQIIEQGVTGMLVIPKHFYRDLLLQQVPVLSYAGDASWFLVYSTIIEGMMGAGETLKAEVKVSRMLFEGVPLAGAEKQYTSIKLNLRPVFNVTGGYTFYVVPAVFVLILHQTLLIGAGLLGGTQKEAGTGYWQEVTPWRLLLMRSLVFTGIYMLLALYYFGFSFWFYDIPRVANPSDLLLLAIPFFLATSMLGIVIGQLIPRREMATLIVMLISLPLIFISGVVWPTEMLPQPINFLAQLIPSTPGIMAFVRLNQMGADFTQIFPLWQQMLGQAFAYGLLALWLMKIKVFPRNI